MAKLTPLQQKLTQVHKDVYERYVEQKKAINEAARAHKIEILFNEILDYFTISSSQPINNFEIANDLKALGLIPGQLFNYTNSSLSDSQLGFQFEKDLEILFQRIFNVLDQQLVTGAEKVYSKMTITGEELTNLPVKAIDICSQETNEWLKFQYGQKRQVKPTDLVRQAGVYGKIDLKLPTSMATIQYEYSSKLQTLITLLQGANITAKCYTNVSSVSFGKANYFRSLSSVLSDLGYSKQDIIGIYKATNTVKYSSLSGSHKAHIRYAYEVLGVGQYVDANGQLQPFGTTDYLIVFNKGANKVHVRSTRDLVRQYMLKTQGTKTYTTSLI